MIISDIKKIGKIRQHSARMCGQYRM